MMFIVFDFIHRVRNMNLNGTLPIIQLYK